MTTPTTPICPCGRPLTGDVVLVCEGCRRNAVECRCRKRMYDGKPGGTGASIFGAYSPTPIYNDRGISTTGSRERRKSDAREDRRAD